jgi:hypothetical protein
MIVLPASCPIGLLSTSNSRRRPIRTKLYKVIVRYPVTTNALSLVEIPEDTYALQTIMSWIKKAYATAVTICING